MSKTIKESKGKRIHTYCRICEPQCALVAQLSEDGQDVERLLPDKSHPIHKGFACHKGLNFLQLHHDQDRNNFPLKRSHGQTKRIEWDEATDEIAQRLLDVSTRYGSDAIATYIGNPSAFNSAGRDAARKFATAIGVNYRFGSGTQDCTNKFAASEAVFGTANLHPIPDYANTDFLLSLGSNPKISHASFVHMTNPMGALRKIVARGGQVKHVNPRNIESVTSATGELVQIKPDTDLYLLAALIHEIKVSDRQDQAWIDKHSTNIEPAWDFVAQFSADKVAPVVGLSADEIRGLAYAFADANSASVHMSTGVNMGRQGTLAYWLVQLLSLVTGNLGRRGGNIYSPGYFPAASVGKPRQQDPFFEGEFGHMRKIAGNLPGNLLIDYMEAGHVKALVCMSGNPLLSVAGETRMAKALENLELLVVVDIYPNATSTYADFILPATDWLEREDVNSVSVGFQPEPYIQYTPAVVPPKHERKPEWWIFAKLLQQLGLPSVLDGNDADPLARLNRQIQSSGITLEQVQTEPAQTVVLPLPDPTDTFELGVQLPDQKMDCFPWLIQTGISAAVAQFHELREQPPSTLKLITLRTNYMMNSWLHNLPALKRDTALDNPIHVHPDDVSQLDLAEGVEVSVRSKFGEIIATIRTDDSLMPGVIAMTHGWGHGSNSHLRVASNHPGTNVNELLPTGPGSYDPLSNMSHMTGIPVTLKQA
ncbi:MAG: molybdopterin-dependent oxidoreductase [Pseudomonadota bacterium]